MKKGWILIIIGSLLILSSFLIVSGFFSCGGPLSSGGYCPQVDTYRGIEWVFYYPQTYVGIALIVLGINKLRKERRIRNL